MPDAAEAFEQVREWNLTGTPAFAYQCSAGHKFTAAEPGWEKLYCPESYLPPKGGPARQCQRPLLRVEPSDEVLRDDLVGLLGELG